MSFMHTIRLLQQAQVVIAHKRVACCQVLPALGGDFSERINDRKCVCRGIHVARSTNGLPEGALLKMPPRASTANWEINRHRCSLSAAANPPAYPCVRQIFDPIIALDTACKKAKKSLQARTFFNRLEEPLTVVPRQCASSSKFLSCPAFPPPSAQQATRWPHAAKAMKLLAHRKN